MSIVYDLELDIVDFPFGRLEGTAGAGMSSESIIS